MLNPTQPVVLADRDGQERKFLLTRGGMRRLREALKCKTLQEILAKVSTDEDGAMNAFLYECWIDKGSMTLEQFEDSMPFNIEEDSKALARILGASLPEPEKDRPTQPPPVIQ